MAKVIAVSETKLVRIHPFEPLRGYHCQRYVLADSGYPVFLEGKGWYEVDPETADKLEKKLNRPDDPRSRPIFEVCTREEAEALDAQEEDEVAAANQPRPLPQAIAARRKARDTGHGRTIAPLPPKPRPAASSDLTTADLNPPEKTPEEIEAELEAADDAVPGPELPTTTGTAKTPIRASSSSPPRAGTTNTRPKKRG